MKKNPELLSLKGQLLSWIKNQQKIENQARKERHYVTARRAQERAGAFYSCYVQVKCLLGELK